MCMLDLLFEVLCRVCCLNCVSLVILLFFFFCKQKTAYEMRISDWSSDVCSSDLVQRAEELVALLAPLLVDRHLLRQDQAVGLAVDLEDLQAEEIGRASCRERVCQYV